MNMYSTETTRPKFYSKVRVLESTDLSGVPSASFEAWASMPDLIVIGFYLKLLLFLAQIVTTISSVITYAFPY